MSLFLSCLTCAKAFEHAGGNAAGYAILMMLILLVVVLGIIFACLIRLGLRSKNNIDPEFRDPLHD